MLLVQDGLGRKQETQKERKEDRSQNIHPHPPFWPNLGLLRNIHLSKLKSKSEGAFSASPSLALAPPKWPRSDGQEKAVEGR